MPAVCSKCYQGSTTCPRAGDSTKDCNGFMMQTAARHIAPNGQFDSVCQLVNPDFAVLTPALGQGLLNGRSGAAGRATIVALTEDEQAMYETRDNDPAYDGIDNTNMAMAIKLARKRPEEIDAIDDRLSDIKQAESTGVACQKVESFQRDLERVKKDYESKVSSGNLVNTTAGAFKDQTCPVSQLFYVMVKKAVDGLDGACLGS